MHVLPVQSAYLRAAGSALARNPTSSGAFLIADKPAETSSSMLCAMGPARITLHEA